MPHQKWVRYKNSRTWPVQKKMERKQKQSKELKHDLINEAGINQKKSYLPHFTMYDFQVFFHE